MSEVITRFAPSPTGMLHLGNVRTALLNFLYARKHGGRFLLRFEDTDRDRSEAEYIKAIEDDLEWLGLNWDGEVLFQSAHAGKHTGALEKLAANGHAYRCFCSESQLAIDRKLATSRGLPPRYAGRCRELSMEESAARAESEPFVWRLRIRSDAGEVTVRDTLRGDVVFALHDLDDPVVVRSDGSFTFLLPNAVDDALDGITHTMRGDDHLTNSAYQVWLLERLGLPAPHYLHHGLLLGQDGAKLSKRSGSHAVSHLRAEGLLPEALVQAMARLGHPNLSEELHGLDMLASHFEAEHLSTSPVRWSDEPMWRWHERLLHHLSPQELVALLKPDFEGVAEEHLAGFAELMRGNLERIEDARQYSRILDASIPFNEGGEVLSAAGTKFLNESLDVWRSLERADWKSWTSGVKERTGCKGRELFLPLRVALTGMMHGPEMSHVVDFLGAEGVASRLEDSLRRVTS